MSTHSDPFQHSAGAASLPALHAGLGVAGVSLASPAQSPIAELDLAGHLRALTPIYVGVVDITLAS